MVDWYIKICDASLEMLKKDILFEVMVWTPLHPMQ